jgi:NAD(P)-dependent dehydrogenase (short-subunit alcohol dehydrogenase family)
MLAHGVAKAGLLNLTRALALELAPRVRVNAVIPGVVLPPDDASAEYLARTADKNLIKQWGNPDQVAQAVLFLIENDFMVGEALHVDGGESLAWRLRHVIRDPA